MDTFGGEDRLVTDMGQLDVLKSKDMEHLQMSTGRLGSNEEQSNFNRRVNLSGIANDELDSDYNRSPSPVLKKQQGTIDYSEDKTKESPQLMHEHRDDTQANVMTSNKTYCSESKESNASLKDDYHQSRSNQAER